MANELPRPGAQTFFDRARNSVITGGHFTAVNTTVNNIRNTKDGFELLQEQVAANAFHDSAQRVDPPRCHENTRQAVLQQIFNWVIQDEGRAAWIAWLNGAAGAGKSAICQSIAEICIAHTILVASFFFFRTDPTRCTIDPLVATLAYQLILLIPEAKDLVCDVLEHNPLIFRQSFETQLNQLIIQPLRQIQLNSPMLKLFLIIDGIDECTGYENQTNIIRTLAKFVAMKDSPILVLFGSRAENQLQAVFRSRAVSGTLLRLPLDDRYLPDDDFLLFVTEKFANIKETHPFGHLLASDWPASDHVQEIVDKSSGQFIYASVVVNFISLPHAFPNTQLDIVRGLRPSGGATPFAQLDALYRHIFSTARDLQTINTVLAFSIITKNSFRPLISQFLQLPAEDITAACSDLASVLFWEKDSIFENFNLRFLHASLPDFLFDQMRSREYCIDIPAWCTRLLVMRFKAVVPDIYVWDETLITLLKTAECTPELQAIIVSFDPNNISRMGDDDSNSNFRFLDDFLTAIKSLDFSDGGEAYEHQLNVVTRYIANRDPQHLRKLKRRHNIKHILSEIKHDQEKERPANTHFKNVKNPARKRREADKSSRRSRVSGSGE